MSVKILKFSADWCQPCKQLATSIEQAKLTIPVEEINVDNEPDSVTQYSVRGVPTLILMRDGTELARSSGYKNVSQLRAFIDANI